MSTFEQRQDQYEGVIADYLQQRIENGDLSAEDISTRLARYGLMDPQDFVDEMLERMGVAYGEDEE